MRAHFTAGVFLSDVKKGFAWKKYKIPASILLIAIAASAGIYFFSPKEKISQAVAPSESVLPKTWLVKYFGVENESDAAVGGAQGDPDDDVLTNWQEYMYGTDPTREDTDGDGDIDSYEVAFNQNPNGPGYLAQTEQNQYYFKDLIEGSQEYSQFSEANIAAEINRMLKPDQAVVMDFPGDAELVISKENSPAAFEKYFEEVRGLITATDEDFQNVQERFFDGMSDAEIDLYISKLQATESVLKKMSVPSEIVNIQKLKIAGLRASVKMFELVRDRYTPENMDSQFWSDLFRYQVAIKTAGIMEVVAWNELGTYLKDTGGWEEIDAGNK